MKLWLCVIVLVSTIFAHGTEARGHRIIARSVDPAADVFKPFEVTMEGQYYWERIYYIDNRGQNNPYKETHKLTKSISTSFSDLKRAVQESSVKTSVSTEVVGAISIINASVKGALDTELTKSYESTVEKKTETSVTEELTREFNVGANSIGEMFRLMYKGPGVTYATGTVSNKELPLEKVFIVCTVKKVPMLRAIDVVYTEQNIDRPDNAILESQRGSPDINAGFGGTFVWLVPVWTSNVNEAVSNIQFVKQSKNNAAYKDLAHGAGGDFRYLKLTKDSSRTRIDRVGLLRSPKSKEIYADRHKYGWNECTQDINADRSGDFLHLCWTTITV